MDRETHRDASTSTSGRRRSTSNPGQASAGLGIDSGGGFYANYPGGSQSFSSYFSRGGQPWSHVAITYDGWTVRAFVNGQLQTSVATTAADVPARPGGIYDTGAVRAREPWTVVITKSEQSAAEVENSSAA